MRSSSGDDDIKDDGKRSAYPPGPVDASQRDSGHAWRRHQEGELLCLHVERLAELNLQAGKALLLLDMPLDTLHHILSLAIRQTHPLLRRQYRDQVLGLVCKRIGALAMGLSTHVFVIPPDCSPPITLGIRRHMMQINHLCTTLGNVRQLSCAIADDYDARAGCRAGIAYLPSFTPSYASPLRAWWLPPHPSARHSTGRSVLRKREFGAFECRYAIEGIG